MRASARARFADYCTRTPNRANISRRPKLVTASALLSKSCTTHFFFNANFRSAAPSAPPTCGFRSLQSRHAHPNRRRSARAASTSIPSASSAFTPRAVSSYEPSPFEIHPSAANLIVQRNSQCPRDVIVTSSRRAQSARSARLKFSPRTTRQHAQSFESPRHFRPVQTVESVLSLHQNFYQPLNLQSIQVYARRRGTHLRHHRKLRAGPRAPIHQTKQHPRPRRLPNRRRDPRYRNLCVILYIHTSILIKSYMSVNAAAVAQALSL